MTDLIQNAIVAAVILLAFAYVARQARRTLSGRRTRCGGCSGDSSNASAGVPKIKPFVPVESLEASTRMELED